LLFLFSESEVTKNPPPPPALEQVKTPSPPRTKNEILGDELKRHYTAGAEHLTPPERVAREHLENFLKEQKLEHLIEKMPKSKPKRGWEMWMNNLITKGMVYPKEPKKSLFDKVIAALSPGRKAK